MYVTELIKTNH